MNTWLGERMNIWLGKGMKKAAMVSEVGSDLVINQWYIASVRMALISFQFHHRPTEMRSPVDCRRWSSTDLACNWFRYGSQERGCRVWVWSWKLGPRTSTVIVVFVTTRRGHVIKVRISIEVGELGNSDSFVGTHGGLERRREISGLVSSYVLGWWILVFPWSVLSLDRVEYRT